MTLFIIDPGFAKPAFPERLGTHLDRLSRDYQVRIPGRSGTALEKDFLEIDGGLFGRLQSAAEKNINKKVGQK
jgi:hypothetical protein